jgi:NitT/TauT family transport system permease protein
MKPTGKAVSGNSKNRYREIAIRLAGTLAGLALWQAASMRMHSLVIASPMETLHALIALAGSRDFYQNHFLTSFKRMFAGIFIGTIAGILLGIAAGVNQDLKHFLEPFFWVLMGIPAVVVVVVAMLWLGMGSSMVVFIASLLLTPVVYINTARGIEAVDPKLKEVTAIYRFSWWMRIRHFYLMSVAAPVGAALAIVVGNGVRIVILAEVMGADGGIGFVLSRARTCLEIPDLYACVLLSLIIVFVFEMLLIRPLENSLTHWRGCHDR